MSKRKHSELDYINDELKKLKKKLKRALKNKNPVSSSEAEENDVSDLLGPPESLAENENADPTDVITPDLDADPNKEIPTTPSPTHVDLTTSEDQPKEPDEDTLDKDILEILGDDPENKVQYGPEIHKELASRLQHISSTGLTKEAKKELQQKYLLPSNAVLLGAPLMNPEIKAALPETLVSRDKAIEAKQKLLGAAISCLATATSSLLGSQNKDNETLRKLMDGCRILCEIQHADSMTRRMLSTSALKKDIKSQILTSKIDNFLFGQNLPDALKTAKAVSKTSAEIKSSHSTTNKKPQPSTSKANLNAKAPAGPPRKPPVTAQRTRQPGSHQSQPAKQYRPSSQQQKNNNTYRRT